MLSPSRPRGIGASPQASRTPFLWWVWEHIAGAAVTAVGPCSAFPLSWPRRSFSSTGIYLAGASVKPINSRAFLEMLLPSCSKELTSLKAQAFFTKPLVPLNHQTTILSTAQGVLRGQCPFYLSLYSFGLLQLASEITPEKASCPIIFVRCFC